MNISALRKASGFLIQIISSFLLFSAVAVAESPALSKLPSYVPQVLPESSLTSVGSDTMEGLVQLWVDAYKAVQPGVTVQVSSRGSATAPAALIEGTANIGPMARPMKSNEVEDFKEKFGFEPTQIRTSVSATGIYVSVNNPIKSISLDQLDAIYSADRKRGLPSSITKWSDLKISGELSEKPIMVIGAVPTSYSHAFFRQRVLMQGNFLETVTSAADRKSIGEIIRSNPNAIAYGSLSDYDLNGEMSGVKFIPVQETATSRAYPPTPAAIESETYPLARFLNVCIVRHPGKPLDPVTSDFLHFVLSREGQEVVAKQGLSPLPLSVLSAELAKLK